MEADFRREYDIDLVKELDTMSWRQFLVFVRCFSDQAATVVRLNSSRYIGASKGQVNTVVGPKAAEAAFQAAFAK